MDEWKYYRNYEVSVWTLLDNYITTLKSGDPILVASESAAVWPLARAQGQILNGYIELNIDGTLTLSFDIPMYLYINGEKIENPNWYDAINKNILTSMRKIKIIFNKWLNLDDKEAMSNSTFEFIILKVQETHEQDDLMCHVECEGLAFHELGKVGYKRSLTTEEFNNEYYEWSIREYANDLEKEAAKPVANLLYWMTKAKIDPVPKNGSSIDYDSINPTKWYYDIRMAHTSLYHKETVYDDKIYEEGYATDWTDNNVPINYIETREMARLVDINESNLYNITLDLAEKFSVFCRYQYIYDNNYNIVGRLIIFYNNFLLEDIDVQTLMYPNSASKISREMDSTDVSTKMFVRSVDNDELYSGSINIMDCSANKSLEDYLLNFDYLHEIGTINDELYKAIALYEKDMRRLNKQITPLLEARNNLLTIKTDIDAKVLTLARSIELDEERITENGALMLALDLYDGDEDGYITRDYRNPEIISLLKDSSNALYDSYYILLNLNDKTRGIAPETLEIYKDYVTTSTKTYSYGIGFTSWNASGYTVNENANKVNIPNEVSYELIYKGTYGSSGDVTSLPTASNDNKGWVYFQLSNDNLRYSNGTSWGTISKPSSYNNKNGFFIYKRETLNLINGLTTEVCTCSRKAATTTSTDYISRIRRLYYTTVSGAQPSAPTVESATTTATEIASRNVINQWSSYLSLPDDTSEKIIYRVWEQRYAHGNIKYSGVNSITHDVTGDTIDDRIAAAKSNVLTNKLSGQYVTDEYGNLDKVTGLFTTSKLGSYFSYGIQLSPMTIPANATYNSINTIVSDLDNLATETTHPSDRRGKYVIIRELQRYSNGNTVYLYRLNYYDNDDIRTKPSEGTPIASIIPVFYLSTSSTAPNGISNVTDKNVKNAWTTVLPDKTDSSWNYYRGWAVSVYNSDTVSYYMKSGIDTSLKKKKTSNTTDDEAEIPKYVYAIYKYKPTLYYEKIKASWELKLYDDNKDLEKNEDKKAALETLIENMKTLIDEKTQELEELRLKFEHVMGAALRESYWLPEDEYLNYGTKYNEGLKLFTSNLFNRPGSTYFKNKTDGLFARIGWDGIKYDEEQELYYESSINKTKIYYPCIDLTKLTTTMSNSDTDFITAYLTWASSGSETNPFSFYFNPATLTIPIDDNVNENDIRYCLYYTIGSRAKLAFVRHKTNVIPVLILVDASLLSDAELVNLYKNGKLGLLTPTKEDNHVILKMDKATSYAIPDNAWINISKSGDTIGNRTSSYMDEFSLVYPRIIIPSLKLKNNDTDLVILYNNTKLNNYEDYYVLTNSYYRNETAAFIDNEITYYKYDYRDLDTIGANKLENTDKFVNYYTITIKPEYLFTHVDLSPNSFSSIIFNVYYALSNADVSIYLDAKKILKENAYPKVAYEIEVSKWSPTLLSELYSKLAQIVMINDYELKLQETFGYISSVKLDLDHEEKDTIEVKNYKTKFEDLFSKIVAETEEMHKNSYNIGLAGALASGEGVSAILNKEGFENTLNQISNKEILELFLSEYFDNAEVVLKKLLELWDEAGQILGSASQSLNAVVGTTTKNANILAGFRESITEAMTPTVYTGTAQPSTFKPGDIWINGDYTAVATGYNGTGGFTRTHDGSLALITGTSLDIDAEEGKIDILAETEINLMSGKDVNIAAGDTVNIVGNKEVNIGGTTINMASSTISGEGYPTQVGAGGIHLVSTSYTYTSGDGALTENLDSISRVDIHGDGIELASKNGIIIKSGAGIDIKSTSSGNVSAVQIDKDKGVWIGSNKTVSLFSGTISAGENASGASIELSPSHLLLGVGATGSDTAIELSKELIILAAGGSLSSITSATLTDSASLSGLLIKQDYIGMATGSSSSRSIFALTPGEIRLGTMSGSGNDPSGYTGDFLWLSKGDVYIGSSGNLTLNTDNIKIQTKLLSSATASASETAQQAVSKMGFVLGKSLNSATTSSREPKLGFWMDTSGDSHLVVNGDITASKFVASSSNGLFIADGNKFGLYDAQGTEGLLTIDSNGHIIAKNFSVEVELRNSSNAKIGHFSINTANLLLTSDYKSVLLMYSGGGNWNSATTGLRFSVDPNVGLEVKGAITATSFNLSGNAVSLFNTAVANSGAFTVDGLSILTWNNNSYVALTQAGDNYAGVLVGTTGADKHFIIPRDASATAVDISKTAIKFDYDTNTHIYLNSDGIDVTGKRIRIGGDDVWARDDIIVMKLNPTHPWEDSVEHILKYMNNLTVTINNTSYNRGSVAHDWVLILPYYNAQNAFYKTLVFLVTGVNASGGGLTFEFVISPPSNYAAFGDAASTYTYSIEFDMRVVSANNNGVTTSSFDCTVLELSKDRSLTFTIPVIATNSAGTLTGLFQTSGYGSALHYLATILRTESTGNRVNLCIDNLSQLKVTIKCALTGAIIEIKDLLLTLSTDATTSKVPCTVYYYP